MECLRYNLCLGQSVIQAHIFGKLAVAGVLHAVRLQQESSKRGKKIAAAVYRYQADCDGEWSKIQLVLENGAVETVRLAVWDTIGRKVFT